MKNEAIALMAPQQTPLVSASDMRVLGLVPSQGGSSRLAQALADESAQTQRLLDSLQAGFAPPPNIRNLVTGHRGLLIGDFQIPIGDALAERDADGLPGVYQALGQVAATVKEGGNVSIDFSRIRPAGRQSTDEMCEAIGPVACMGIFEAAFETYCGITPGHHRIQLAIDHPDIAYFLSRTFRRKVEIAMISNAPRACEQHERRVEQAYEDKWKKALPDNLSLEVLITEEFNQALRNGEPFELCHAVKPAWKAPSRIRGGKEVFVYGTVCTRALWDAIHSRSSSDEGLIVSRGDDSNNLRYCESPGSFYGSVCNGTIELPMFIENGGTSRAEFKRDQFCDAVWAAVELLDQAYDKTKWPLSAQESDGEAKRKLGLDLAHVDLAAEMLRPTRVGSEHDDSFQVEVFRLFKSAAYAASVNLAKKHGPFPLFDADSYLSDGTVASQLPSDLQRDIRTFGVRNGQLLSISPSNLVWSSV